MKINFVKSADFLMLKNSVAVLVITQEKAKNSKLKQVKFAAENFDFSGKNNQAHLISLDGKVVALIGAVPSL